MKHILRILKYLLIGFFIKLPMKVSAYFVVPIVCLFYWNDKRILRNDLIDQRLPSFLAWYDNGDELDRVYGLNGDMWQQRLYFLNNGITNFTIYKNRVRWLLRNAVNYFQYNVLGFKLDSIFYTDSEITIDGGSDPYNSEEPSDYRIGGTLYREVHRADGETAYEYYLVKPYYKLFPNRCLRIRLGYKLDDHTLKNRKVAQFAFAIHPWHGYTGVKL